MFSWWWIPYLRYKPAHDKTYNMTRVTSKDPDQRVRPPSMARVLIYPPLDSREAVEGTCDQQRPWSDCMDVQADLCLCWSHNSYCRFCSGLAHMAIFLANYLTVIQIFSWYCYFLSILLDCDMIIFSVNYLTVILLFSQWIIWLWHSYFFQWIIWLWHSYFFNELFDCDMLITPDICCTFDPKVWSDTFYQTVVNNKSANSCFLLLPIQNSCFLSLLFSTLEKS